MHTAYVVLHPFKCYKCSNTRDIFNSIWCKAKDVLCIEQSVAVDKRKAKTRKRKKNKEIQIHNTTRLWLRVDKTTRHMYMFYRLRTQPQWCLWIRKQNARFRKMFNLKINRKLCSDFPCVLTDFPNENGNARRENEMRIFGGIAGGEVFLFSSLYRLFERF